MNNAETCSLMDLLSGVDDVDGIVEDRFSRIGLEFRTEINSDSNRNKSKNIRLCRHLVI